MESQACWQSLSWREWKWIQIIDQQTVGIATNSTNFGPVFTITWNTNAGKKKNTSARFAATPLRENITSDAISGIFMKKPWNNPRACLLIKPCNLRNRLFVLLCAESFIYAVCILTVARIMLRRYQRNWWCAPNKSEYLCQRSLFVSLFVLKEDLAILSMLFALKTKVKDVSLHCTPYFSVLVTFWLSRSIRWKSLAVISVVLPADIKTTNRLPFMWLVPKNKNKLPMGRLLATPYLSCHHLFL